MIFKDISKADTDPGVELPHLMSTGTRYKKADPAYFYVYLLNQNEKVIYVGITQNPGGRFAQYTGRGRFGGHNASLSAALNGGVNMTLIAYLPEKEARQLESKLIREYQGSVANRTVKL